MGMRYSFVAASLLFAVPALAQTTPPGAVPPAVVPSGAKCFSAGDPTGKDIVLVASNNTQDAADSIAGINAGRAQEGLPAIVLPSNYATLSPSQELLTLVNLERTARGLPPLNTAASLSDLQLDLEAFNHSTLLATIPALFGDANLFNPASAGDAANDATAHENSVEGDLYSRLLAIPAVLAANGDPMFGVPLTMPGNVQIRLAENVNSASTVEAAVFSWMYQDSDSGYGHRENILNCFMTNAGVGIVQARTQPDGTIAGPFETLDFIGSNGSYVPTYVDPTPTVTSTQFPTAKPPLTGQTLADQIEPVSSSLVSFSVTPATTAGMVTVTFIASLPVIYGAENNFRTVEIVAPANWGATDAFGNVLGELPVDASTRLCTPVRNMAAPGGSDTYTCTMTIPTPTYPLQVLGVDIWDRVVIATQASAPQPSVLAGTATPQ